MNRSIDYRSDFYALGMTFYELLTGQTAFRAGDAMELVHCHIARTPQPPSLLNPMVPEVLSSMVMKLVSKMAEERYQSALGLLHDLKECQQQLQQNNAVEAFPIATRDVSHQLRLPQKLYGRAGDIERLRQEFARASAGQQQLLLISGYPGVGKSALVQEVHKGIAEGGGLMIAGKFDLLSRSVPYSAVLHAFRELMRQLLSEPEEHLSKWRLQIQSAVGRNGQVLVELIPELEQIIGPQPAIPELGATESQNRFGLVFQNFLRVFSRPGQTLVVFLDDLQWADLASLRLLETLLADSSGGHLLFLGAYRDNEVDSLHPLSRTCSKLREAGVQIQEIRLQPLSFADVVQLLTDTLGGTGERVDELAKLVFSKTQGNPFFVSQFVNRLYREKILRLNLSTGMWQWDMLGIQGLQATDNVVDFLLGQLRSLKPETQSMLSLGACIGYRFELKTLALIGEATAAETAERLWEVMREGLIVPVDMDYRFLHTAADVGTEFSVNYRFLHDRVQQAAYALIPEERRREIHLRIGRLLRARSAQIPEDDLLFEIVDHMNQGAALISDAEERRELLRLNFLAGRKAKSSAAYQTAASYLSAGAKNLTAEAWSTHFDQTYALHLELAECEYLSGRLTEAEALFALLLSHARSTVEKADVYTLVTVLTFGSGQIRESVKIGRQALKIFDIHLPDSPAEVQAAMGAEMVAIPQNQGGRSFEALLDAPAVADAGLQAQMRLLSSIVAPAYVAEPLLFGLLVAKIVNLSLQHGRSAMTAFAYAVYGLFLTDAGEYQGGYEFGRLGLRLEERFPDPHLTAKLSLLFGAFIHFVRDPLSVGFTHVERGRIGGLEAGDFAYASYCCIHPPLFRLFIGHDLTQIQEEAEGFLKLMGRTKDAITTEMLRVSRQQAIALRGNSRGRTELADGAFDEGEFVERMTRDHFSLDLCWYYTAKGELLYLYENHAAATAMLAKADEWKNYATGMIFKTSIVYFTALNDLARYAKLPSDEQAQLRPEIERRVADIRRLAEGCPANFATRHLVLRAEYARVFGKPEEAAQLFDEAIDCAQKYEMLRDEALANELGAKFHIGAGRHKRARFYIQEAFSAYQRWGATAKVNQLREQYATLLANFHGSPGQEGDGTATGSISMDGAATLDLRSVTKAAQALSSEIQLDRLLARLTRILIENAGAQRGLVLLPRSTHWTIEAYGTSESSDVAVLLSLPLQGSTQLCEAVVNYVVRTQEHVVLTHASQQGPFRNDPYITSHRVKSLLCVPVRQSGALMAIVYLENNLSEGCFTDDRVSLLRILSAQMAISIENARLYATLEQKVQARTQELSDKNTALTAAVEELQIMQQQLVHQEKLASLGALTAGIAHEIRNPLNFINNFAESAVMLVDDVVDTLSRPAVPSSNDVAIPLLRDLRESVEKIHKHGQRANSIITGMLQHARNSSSSPEVVDINAFVTESLNLAYHGIRAKDAKFKVAVETAYDPAVGQGELIRSDVSRVFINILNNAFYSTRKKQQELGAAYAPVISVRTRSHGDRWELLVRDNGVGIARDILNKIFTPFFTTKPPGEGTGLGLSISHDIIVQGHQGAIRVDSEEGQFAEFVISMPKRGLHRGASDRSGRG